jgi:hypothetical protein
MRFSPYCPKSCWLRWWDQLTSSLCNQRFKKCKKSFFISREKLRLFSLGRTCSPLWKNMGWVVFHTFHFQCAEFLEVTPNHVNARNIGLTHQPRALWNLTLISRELDPASVDGNQRTGLWSRFLHFIGNPSPAQDNDDQTAGTKPTGLFNSLH